MAPSGIAPPPRSNYHRFTQRFKLYTPKFVLAIFVLTNFFTYFDRGVMTGALIDISTDPTISGGTKKLSSTEGGALGSAFMVGFFATSPIFASMGSCFRPKTIILIGLTGWLLAAVGSGCSVDFYMLAVCRCLVGTGEAAYVGYMITMVDNMAPVPSRTLWVGIFYSMIVVGIALGTIVGGTMANKIHVSEMITGWRIAFISEVVPMLILYVFIFFLPDDYNHGVEEGEDVPSASGEGNTAAVSGGGGAGAEGGGPYGSSLRIHQEGGINVSSGGLGNGGGADAAAGESTSKFHQHGTSATNNGGGYQSTHPQSPPSDDFSPLPYRRSVDGGSAVTGPSINDEEHEAADRDDDERRRLIGGGGGGGEKTSQSYAQGKTVDSTENDAPFIDPEIVPPPIQRAIPLLLCNIKWLCLVLGYGAYTFALGGIVNWCIPLMVYGPLTLKKETATMLLGSICAVTGFAGSIVGGTILDKMGGSQGLLGTYRSCAFMALVITMGFPCGVIALLSTSLGLFLPFIILGVMCLFTIQAPVNAAILTSVPKNMRTYAINFSVLIMHALGDFPSPMLAGAISDAYSEGCSNRLINTTCIGNYTDHGCRWFPAPDAHSDAACVNEHQWPKALAWIYAFCGLSIPLWGFVAWKAKREWRREQTAEDRE